MFDCPTCSDSFNSKKGLSIHHTKKHGEKIDADERTEVCPKCERSFKTKRGMKMHHSSVHNESISGEIVSCENCGKEKRVKPYRLEKFDRFFCSRDCKSEYEKTERLEKYCETCGDKFTTTQWRDATYCCIDCSQGTKKIECRYCEEEYYTDRSADSSFCSKNCQHSWQSENWREENAPAWKGGYDDYYGHTWQTRRKDIQQRDSNVCQFCGFDSNDTLDVHHIVPVRTFDDPDDAHFDENMCQLCDKCHVTFEKMDAIKQKKLLDDEELDSLERVENVMSNDGTADTLTRIKEIMEST